MIVYVITRYWTEYSDYDGCGCGTTEQRDVEMFTTPEKAISKLKEIRETQKTSQFQSEQNCWYDLHVREIE